MHKSNRTCKFCTLIFIDNSDSQSAKYCSKKCNGAHFYKLNKDKCSSYGAQYRENNKSKIKALNSEWRKNNLDKAAATLAKYRASKLKQTPKWLTEEHYRQIERFYTVARWVESILGEPIEVDHIIPLQGEEAKGLHVPWNLQLLTRTENVSKSNKIKAPELVAPAPSTVEIPKN